MGFSATGSLLKGSSLRPDILTGVLVDDKNVYIRSGLNSRLNILGIYQLSAHYQVMVDLD
ncbi:hypothetical protein [Parachlamydia acanthamoebae]|uniref:Uncharacterized protein n=1 Tax=Parachlamydia acanthamoebae TaxID=83552 RepID=A0A0C1C3U9_9BACT|nr:hypothetical protein [Parachlamydia acanthamoebae]KIA78191.1 hypothetical protein DB43_EL00020 [Parachlamydia acanthamoebae]